MYGLAFAFGNASIVDFHEYAFGVPLLAFAGVAFVEKRYSAVVWWSLPLLLVKEDMGVTVAAVGVALWLVGERRRGLLLAIGGAVALVLVVWVIIPAFNTGGGYDYTGNLGGDAGVLETLTTEWDRKLLTLLLTLGITGFAALWSPWAVVAAPTFLWRFLGDVHWYWGTEWHYSMVHHADLLRRHDRRDRAAPPTGVARGRPRRRRERLHAGRRSGREAARARDVGCVAAP